MFRRRTLPLFTALSGLLVATQARADIAPGPGEKYSPPRRQAEPPIEEPIAEVAATAGGEKPGIIEQPEPPAVAEKTAAPPVTADKSPAPAAEAKGGCSIGEGSGGASIGLALVIVAAASRRRRAGI